MSMENPYAAPNVPPVQKPGPGMYPNATQEPGRIWRSGNLLVMEKWAQLPDICVKTNEPTNGLYLRRRMHWHHPAIFLLILINLILYAVVALILQKKATVDVGLSPSRFTRRRLGIALGWLSALGGVVLFIAGVVMVDTNSSLGGPLLILSPIVLLVGIIAGSIMAKVVSPKKITDELVILKGVNGEYLNRFPEWPFNPVW
jgi:hypothetical protein